MSNETNEELYAKMAPLISDAVITAAIQTATEICKSCKFDIDSMELIKSLAFQQGSYNWAVLNQELCKVLMVSDTQEKHYLENTLKAMKKHGILQTRKTP